MAHPFRLLLVDINVLGFGAMREWAYVNRAFDGKPTGVIHGTLDKLFALLAGHPDHVALVLWDDRWHWCERILLSPATGRCVTLADLADAPAVKGGPFSSTGHCVQAKALAGDASDGIPGVAGVGLKIAARMIGEHGSVEALGSRHDAGLPIKDVIQPRAAGPDYRDFCRRNLPYHSGP